MMIERMRYARFQTAHTGEEYGETLCQITPDPGFYPVFNRN